MAIIKNINLTLGSFNLSVRELEVPDSGVSAFIGPSGSGKSTFFNTLVGLHQPVGWSWDFKGENLAQQPIADRRLGVVFQNYDLFPHMTAEENVRIVYSARNSENRFSETVASLLEKLNLQKCWNTKAANLSGGEKQRVSLLRALISQPRILLLDEPFSALDFHLRNEARILVQSMLRELTIPVYLITHDKEDVSALAQTVVQIDQGRLAGVKKVNI